MTPSRTLLAGLIALAAFPAFAQTADLAITKTAPYSSSAYAGGNTVFPITVTNNGPSAASNVTLTDPLPAGLTYQGVDAPGFSCSGPPVGTNGTVSCTASSFAANAAVAVWVFAGIPTGTPGGTSFTNTATISSSTSDPTPGNNSATATLTVTGGSAPPDDLQMTKLAPTVATAGQLITYQLSFGSSSSTKSNVTVTDALPAGTLFQSVTVNSAPPGTPGFTCTSPAVGTTGTVQCSTPLMFNFPFAEIDVVVKIDPALPIGTSITNTASVSSTTSDPNPGNNSGSAVTVVASPTAADLAITKIAPYSGSAYAGENTVFVLTVTNNGPGTASNVTVADALPAGLTYQGADAPGFTCSGPPIGTNGTVNCTTASMSPNSTSMALYIFAGIPAGTPGGTSFSNTATVSASTSDPVPGNNSSTATLTVSGGSAPPSDMQMTKTAPTVATPGETITYHLSFGSSATTKSNVTVTDALPAGITFQSFSLGSPAEPGFTCTAPAVGATGTVQCSTPLMFSFPFGGVDIVVKVDPSVPIGTSITNTASVSSTTPDPDPSNNSGSATTSIIAAPDLTITKSHSGFFVQGQGGATYVITVKNAGTAPTSGTVTVTDSVPAGMTATAMSGTGWSCDLPSTTCTRSDVLAVAASYPPITLTVNVATNAAPVVTNSATVSGGGELITTNDTADDVTTIVQPAPVLDPLALALLAVVLCAISLIKVAGR